MSANKPVDETGAPTAETTTESNPRSEAQQEASRINGRKSQGPTSIDGLQRSSRNATKLGLYTSRVVLANESQDIYNQFLAGYLADWSPVGITETDILVEMVNARWRLRRVWAEHTAIQDMEMFWLKDDIDAKCAPMNPGLRQGDAILNLSVENPAALEHCRRAEAHFSRIYHRSLKDLITMQTMRLGHSPKLTEIKPHPPVPNNAIAQDPAPDSGPNPNPPSPVPVELENEPGGIQVNFVEPEVFSNFSQFRDSPRASKNDPNGRKRPTGEPPADLAA